MNTKKYQIEDIINLLKAGILNLPDDEKENILDISCQYLTQLSQKPLKKNLNHLIELFSLLELTELRHHVALKMETEIFYDFGKKLISIKDEHLIQGYLEIFRSPNFLKKIYNQQEWPDLILSLLEASNYNFAKLFFHRAEKYKTKILFSVLDSKKIFDYTWKKVLDNVSSYANGLVALLGSKYQNEKVAFFTTNSLDMVLFDIACLTSGIVNVMIPANSVESHIEYILKLTKPKVVIVSGKEQLEKIRKIKTGLEFIKSLIILSKHETEEENIFSITKIINLARDIDVNDFSSNSQKIQIDNLASIMFTSARIMTR